VTGPTPLLDFFRKGVVERDVRLEAASGVLAPRAHEQLAILILLVEDPDLEVRTTAEDTLNQIPLETLQVFLGRSDVPVDLREFFGDRGIFPAEIPQIEIDIDEPLLDASPPEPDANEDEDRDTALQKLQKMSFTGRLKAAVKGSREMRAILIHDSNKMIAAAVLSSPKVSGPEAESFARMANVSEDVLRIIASNRAWMKSYGCLLALVKNPKTPLGLSINLMARIADRDVGKLSVDRNVPEPLRVAARKKVVAATAKK
jgi:hypothetical protein